MQYRVNFFTTVNYEVFVDAANEEDAEEKAFQMVEENPDFFEIVDDTVTMECLSIDEIGDE